MEQSGHMLLPTFYQVDEQSFHIRPQHRPETFVVQHLVRGEFTVSIASQTDAKEILSEVLVNVGDHLVSVRHQKGQPLSDQDHQFLTQIPKLFSFLGMEPGEHKKFNELFYGLFWDAVPLKS